MKIIALLCALLASTSLQAWNCKFEKNFDQSLDLSNSETLSVLAAAGDLEIKGVDQGDQASIRGRVCVSEEEWLDESRLATRGGQDAEIVVELPDVGDGWSLTGSRYAYMDLRLEVPAGVVLDIKDSAGDVEIDGVGEVRVKDSSGDIEIENTSGSATVQDSSGDIVFSKIGGDVTIVSDSSGDIRGKGITGSVLVRSDSSGDILFSDVGENFIVERDSSGDISANVVAGDFRVLKDGSGEISATDVSGEVSTPNS